MSFLSGRGAMPLQLLANVPIILDYSVSSPSTQAWTTWTTSETSALPVNPVIHINGNNSFFFDTGFHSSINGRTIYSGTPYDQALTLLHELGHAAGVLPPDLATAQSTANSATVMQHCSKTLSGFSNK